MTYDIIIVDTASHTLPQVALQEKGNQGYWVAGTLPNGSVIMQRPRPDAVQSPRSSPELRAEKSR